MSVFLFYLTLGVNAFAMSISGSSPDSFPALGPLSHKFRPDQSKTSRSRTSAGSLSRARALTSLTPITKGNDALDMPAPTTSPLKDNLKALQALPGASLVAVAASGSASLEQRQLCANAFEHFMLQEGTHGCEVARRMRWIESNVRREERGGGILAELIAEIDVERGAVSVRDGLLGCFPSSRHDQRARHARRAVRHSHPRHVRHAPCRNMYLIKRTVSWSINAICQLGIALNIDTTGVSQTLDVVFHQPAFLYALL